MITEIGFSSFLDGFVLHDFAPNDGPRIRFAKAGKGPALLLLHGHPQTHVTWHKVAPDLAKEYTVIAADLRGYGDSEKPEGGENHIAYSKREMARDAVALMKALGHDQFSVIGHDRGARVAHRMALDHPAAVVRLALLDIAPTSFMYAHTDKQFATRYFWWFFLIQPFPLPEKLISADPAYYLRQHISGQIKTDDATPSNIMDEYLRCYENPATVHAICEDYRAAASVDLEHDATDADQKVAAPVLVLWGRRGTVGALYDVLATWRIKATHVSGEALDCGHTPQEEAPGILLEKLGAFLVCH